MSTTPDLYAEWLRKGTHLIGAATLTAEMAALANDADKEAERTDTQRANDRAALALRAAVGHLHEHPAVAEVQRLREALEHCELWLPAGCAAAFEARAALNNGG